MGSLSAPRTWSGSGPAGPGTSWSSAAARPGWVPPSTRPRGATGRRCFEARDFAQGTSSRSTKLIHGGVRYLAQGDIPLVREALHERGLLFRNAPHLVHRREFVVPAYRWLDLPFYGIGLKVYDLLAGRSNLGGLAADPAGRGGRAAADDHHPRPARRDRLHRRPVRRRPAGDHAGADVRRPGRRGAEPRPDRRVHATRRPDRRGRSSATTRPARS